MWKLLASGFDVYHRLGIADALTRLAIDDYVSGYLDACVDVARELSGSDQVNLLGICQGGVFTTCFAALFPHKVRNLALTVTPLDFHGDKKEPQTGAGYMNRWARSLTPQDIDDLVEAYGSAPGSMVGFSFLMMNPVSNLTKYTIDLIDILDPVDAYSAARFRADAMRTVAAVRARNAAMVQGSVSGQQVDFNELPRRSQVAYAT